MSIVLIVEVKNQLENSRRSINVYHHHTGIADVVCFNRSISLTLRELTGNKQQDYLQISIEKQSESSPCYYLIDLPLWVHFQVDLKGRAGIAATYAGNRNILKLTLSYDYWQMKIFRPAESDFSTNDSVTIQDRPGPLPAVSKTHRTPAIKNQGDTPKKQFPGRGGSRTAQQNAFGDQGLF